MITEILEFNEETLKKAREYILSSELVAIPTETVYGLGANGLLSESCKKIFEVKNRPADNPLILHISNYEMMDNLVYGLDEDIKSFLNNFWPGPLTVVMKKKEIVPDVVSCGLDTVAIRMPKSEIARELIESCGVPLSAPSANTSGRPSPTTAKDVFYDMDGKIPLIIDGGDCNIGIESTVLDITTEPYTILRPGFFGEEDFLKFKKEIKVDNSLLGKDEKPKSPGQKYKHYAPNAKVVVIVSNDWEKTSQKIEEIYKNNIDKKIGIFKFEQTKITVPCENVLSLGNKENLIEMSKILFKGLREFDEKNVDLIIVEGCEEKGFGFSIMNRLKKSSNGNVIYLDKVVDL